MADATEGTAFETVGSLVGNAPMVGTGIKIVEFIYGFGKTNPIERALGDIRREIDLIKSQLDELNGRLDTVTQRLVKAENLARIRSLQEHVIRLSALGVQLERNPGDSSGAAAAAAEAGARADTFLSDQDLWLWSDVRIVTPHDGFGKPTGPPRIEAVPPDFKTALALPVYSMALTIFITAVMIDTGSNPTVVRARYGAQLDRHIAAVSVRPGWNDGGSPANTIQERIRSRITCHPVPVHQYAQNGVCTFAVQCDNSISRTSTILREFDVTVSDPGPSVLCTINPEVVELDERQAEDDDQTIVMLTRWQEMLESVAHHGHLPRDEFNVPFGGQVVRVEMYGVDRDLNLDYFTQNQPSKDGSWRGPLRVGTSWNFEAIVPGGLSAVLAKQPTGNWLWYWHGGSEKDPATDEWTGPNSVGRWDGSDPAVTKWAYFGAGRGVVYGIVLYDETWILRDGDLFWNRMPGYRTGEGSFAEAQQVGSGWGGLSPVFCGGEGVIYGVRESGVLRWYRHTGWETGADTWDEPRDLNTNVDWRQFERIFSAGSGLIYGVLPNGAMHCYRHQDWRKGGDRFEGPISVGDAGSLYRPLFAQLFENRDSSGVK